MSYSYRSATMGSTHMARRAGTAQAASATIASKAMAEDHLLIAADFAIFFSESAAERGRNAQQSEPRGRDQHPADLLRRTIQLHNLIAWGEHGLALESRHFSKTVEIVPGTAVVWTRRRRLSGIRWT